MLKTFLSKYRTSCKCFNERPYTLNHMLTLTSLTFRITLPNIEFRFKEYLVSSSTNREIPMYSNCSYVFVSIWHTLLIYVLFHTRWTGTYVWNVMIFEFQHCHQCHLFSKMINSINWLWAFERLTDNGKRNNNLIFKIRTSANPLSMMNVQLYNYKSEIDQTVQNARFNINFRRISVQWR